MKNKLDKSKDKILMQRKYYIDLHDLVVHKDIDGIINYLNDLKKKISIEHVLVSESANLGEMPEYCFVYYTLETDLEYQERQDQIKKIEENKNSFDELIKKKNDLQNQANEVIRTWSELNSKINELAAEIDFTLQNKQ